MKGLIGLTAVGLVPALALGGVWGWSEREVAQVERSEPPAATAPAPLPAAPLLSVRRAPTELSSEISQANLRSALSTNLVTGLNDRSCLAVAVGGELVVAAGTIGTVIPASNLKLLVAAVALEVLGPDYRFATGAHGNLVGDTVEGDLFLVGGGDPLLATFGYESIPKYQPIPATQLADLAGALVDAGVRRITGGVVGDESRYDAERWGPGWAEDVKGVEAGPLSALMVNDSKEVAQGVARRVDDPARSAAAQFTDLLRSYGIEVDGDPSAGISPGTPSLVEIHSAPLGEVVGEALLNSDNNTAELLLKEIGVATSGEGSSAAGARGILSTLGTWGIPTDGLAIIDGSGLSPWNQVRCTTVIGVLQHIGASGPLFDGLPIAGVSGTLGPLDAEAGKPDNQDQFLGTAVEGVMRAKTGTLGDAGAKGLSGFLPVDGGTPIVFSLLGNVDVAGQAATEGIVLPWWRELAEALGSYAPGPPADSLAPQAS